MVAAKVIGLLSAFVICGFACVKIRSGSGLKNLEQASYEGVATYFDALGTPYGGCGVPQSILETPYFVALNVQDTPGDYTSFLRRPIQDQTKLGAWDNGKNCGRWVRVTIGDYCEGAYNSGAPSSGICRGGNWVADQFNGATLDMLVTDSCQDDNVWCRDSRYHLDLSTASLEAFRPGLSQKWGNRMVKWSYIKAPQYKGEPRIGFRKDAKAEWPAIVISNLENGLHGVEQDIQGNFQPVRMDGDMGQSYVLIPTPDRRFRIRLLDAEDRLVQGGKVFEFELPSSCLKGCPEAFTEVTMMRSESTEMSSETRTAPMTPREAQGQFESLETIGLLKASVKVRSEWSAGFCADLTVKNVGSQALSAWSILLKTKGNDIAQSWNLSLSREGQGYRLEPSESWAKTLAPQAESTGLGFCMNVPWRSDLLEMTL